MHDTDNRPEPERIVDAERSTWTQDYTRRYSRGDSIRTIARDTGRSYGFVHRALTQAGVTFRPRGNSLLRRTR